jgi:UTP--glucose-1-phosphate uridylyltransferase
MLTVVDRPVVQHVVDEAREAGIEHFIFVTGRNKAVIEDHFDKQFELEATLEARGKTKELAALQRDLPGAGQASFTRQQEPLGLGHAVWCARDIVGNEPFALLLPDMLHHGPSCLAGMMKVYGETGGNVLSVNEVPKDQVQQYGSVGVGERKGAGFKITGMVEKPKAADAPSNYSISGRYILQPEIFALLEKQQKGAGGEIQLTDSMLTLAKAQDFHGYEFEGRIFDCGSKLGFLMANIAYGLERDDLAPALRAEIKSICG